MPTLATLAAFVDETLDARAFPGEPPTVFIASDGPVRRLGLALEPGPGLAEWVDADRLDAVFLHRPWGVADAGLPADTGILASHAPFDHRLTVGANPDPARDLRMRDPHPFGDKDGRRIGMIGDVEPAAPATLVARITDLFGGVDEVLPGRAESIRRIALAGAMTDAMVREAAARGAELYVTGQVRQPGRRAAAETGIGIVAVGHARSEVYGLRLLSDAIGRRFSGQVACVVDPRGTGPAHPLRRDGHPPAPNHP
ncbi:MAG TPA: Nif3-like dinuclear metal center hexameric protein [Longimicrobium sp.]|nr:Nif3-like dinuclear metal center hexameric protein [Longimicrobium sp.]